MHQKASRAFDEKSSGNIDAGERGELFTLLADFISCDVMHVAPALCWSEQVALPTLRWTPHLHSRVISSRSNESTIGRPGSCLRSARIAIRGEKKSSVMSIPRLNGIIIACRNDELAIGRPRDGSDVIRMAIISQEEVPISGIPHLDRVIIAPRGDAGAIRRPRDRAYRSPVMCVPREEVPISGIPHLSSVIVTS